MCQCLNSNNNHYKKSIRICLSYDNLLDTKPKLKPSSVVVRIPEIFVNIRLVRLRNPLADKERPLPNPKSTSAHPSGEVILLNDTFTEPEPEPLCVESSPMANKH